MPDISLVGFIFLSLAGFAAGFFDAMAGGGGVISVPALLSVGMSPAVALSTNKLQSSFGSVTALINYTRHGLLNPKEHIWGVVLTIIGSLLGAILLIYSSATFLSQIIPYLLIAVFIFTLLGKDFGKMESTAKWQKKLFYSIFSPLLGFYDGFFGPGTGTFWTFLHVKLRGLSLRQATAHTKLFNATSNLVSLATFLVVGKLYFTAGLVMAIGQIFGSYTASHMVGKSEANWLRPVFLIVIGITIVNMFLKNT